MSEKITNLGMLITQKVLALSYKSTLPTVASDNNKILEVEGKPLRAYYELNHNGFGLGAVVCRLVRWENCAKPVLPAGTVNLAGT